MTRRGITNLALLASVLGLSLLTWLGTDMGPEESFPALTPLDPSGIRHIELFGRDNTMIELVRKNSAWQMTRPHAATANGPKIKRLLEIAAAVSTERFPIPTGALAQFGLEPPVARLRLDDTRLLIGGTHPIDHRRYILVDDTLHLINDGFAHHLLASASEYELPTGIRKQALPPPETRRGIQ